MRISDWSSDVCSSDLTYASCLVSLVWGVPDFVSAKACAPIWSSCAWETVPTYWVRPVGEVVVAQPATAAPAMRPSRSFFTARIALGSRFRLYRRYDHRPVTPGPPHAAYRRVAGCTRAPRAPPTTA